MFTQARDFVITVFILFYFFRPELLGEWLGKVAVAFTDYTFLMSLQ